MGIVFFDWHSGQAGFVFALRFTRRGFFRGMSLRSRSEPQSVFRSALAASTSN